jgi:hypothetical protein
MREFKPMVKMETTEPTVELKLKKGGAVEKKMARGGAPMGAMIGAPKGGMMPGAKPKKPSLAARRRAMMAQGAAGAPSGRAESMMAATPPAMPAMKKGGESSKVHKAEMKKLSGIKKELTKHEKMPASKGHRGLKTGGVVKGNAGYKAGGAVMMASGGTLTQRDLDRMEMGRGQAIQMSQQMASKDAARKAAEQRAAEQRASAQKAAEQRAAAQKAEMERLRKDKEQRVAAQKAEMERLRKDKEQRVAAENAKAAAAKPKIEGLNPLTGRFDPRAPEYKGPQVTPSMPTTMSKPEPSVMPVPRGKYDGPTLLPKDEMAIPTPVPRVESTAYRRGGKVQNKGKKRGGAVC